MGEPVPVPIPLVSLASLGMSILSLIVSIYIGIIMRMRAPKPKVTVTRSPHWTSAEKNEALHEFIFKNEGSAPAKNLGIHFQLKSKFKIKELSSDRPWNEEKRDGGEGKTFVELIWDQIPPMNIFHIWLTAESSPDINDLFPEMYKIWHDKKIIDQYGV